MIDNFEAIIKGCTEMKRLVNAGENDEALALLL